MAAAIRQIAQSVVQEVSESAAANSTDAVVEEVNRCLVFCRVRPSIPKDYEDGAFQLVSVDKRRVIVKDERHYDFDGTFDQQCKQEDIFYTVALPCVNHAFKGFCSALMCYGQTGTGKSFTMCCTKPGIEGVIPRSAKFIYECIQNDPSRRYTVQGQFIQIYRDQLGDLMSDTGRDKVDIRFENGEGVSLPGCSVHDLKSEAQFMEFYNTGNQRRVVMATAMNPESSRGHTAMVIWIASEPADDPCGAKYRGKITFIDLAGYERFSKTGISNSNAIMKDEAKTINASLLSLGHVVSSLSNGDKHIPWRNAKLTRLLQDSIGGRSRTSIILTVGPSSDHLHETTNTLQFGIRAMAVKVEAKLSVTVDYEKLAAKLQAMLDERNERIGLMEIQIASHDAERAELLARYQRDGESLRSTYEAELAKLIASGADAEQIAKLNEVHAVEVENLNDQHREQFGFVEEAFNKNFVNLVEEQQRQEQRRQAEMRLAQERIIEEFQSKLEAAQGGTNDDLIKAIQQLSDKDAVLASRANDTARLHEHIEALTQQIREMGAEPLHEAKFPETFLDISQIDEMRSSLQGEVERHHLKVVDLRAQLERATLICNERLEDLQAAQLDNDRLREELQKAGVSAEVTSIELAKMELHRARLIDPVEMENMRVSMQTDIDELQSHNDMLQEEITKLKDQIKELQVPVPLTSRVRSLSITGRRPAGFSSAGNGMVGGGDGGPKDELVQQLRDQIKELQASLSKGNQERNTLCQRIADLENRLEDNGIEVDDADCYLEAPPNRDMETLLATNSAEVEAFISTIAKYDQQLSTERNARIFTESINQRLMDQIRSLGAQPVTVDELNPVVASDSVVSMETFQELIRNIHQSNKRLANRLAVRPLEEDIPESEMETILDEKEDELQMRDLVVLTKSTECTSLIRLVDRLERQLRDLGVEPCCGLSEDHKQLLVAEKAEMENMRERQQTMEDDKKKLQGVLELLKQDRVSDTSTKLRMEAELMEAKCKARELEEERERQLQRERLLEEQTRLATRQMMDAQAKIAMSEQSNIFAKFKRRLFS